MTIVKPDARVTQSVHDVVMYECPFADWNGDMRAAAKDGKVRVETLRGDPTRPLFVQAQPSQGAGMRAQRIKVWGGTRGGRYNVVRTVTDGNETRSKSFTVVVE